MRGPEPMTTLEQRFAGSGPLVLSLFPGIGLLDMAFEEEGFCVVRGPDLLWGGDIRRFHPPSGKFDGVIGGPPCQLFSQFRHINPHVGRHGNQIPEFERVVLESSARWFVMENVPAAPEPDVGGYLVRSQLVRDDWVGGATMRLRRFSFGTPAGCPLHVEQLALHGMESRPAVTSASEAIPVKMGGSGKVKASFVEHGKGSRSIESMIEDQGLPAGFLDDCPLTSEGKRRVIGNGVPLALGRAIAKAVKRAMGYELADGAA